eukprot:530756-Amphidinium_carterae.1
MEWENLFLNALCVATMCRGFWTRLTVSLRLLACPSNHPVERTRHNEVRSSVRMLRTTEVGRIAKSRTSATTSLLWSVPREL